jgi:2-dehydro-3-deoxygalactonokinase
MAVQRHFLSCDWGTSTFRLRLVLGTSLAVVDQRTSDRGVAVLAEQSPTGQERARSFKTYLGTQVRALCEKNRVDPIACPVIISGMAGSSIGWEELPYATAPFPLDGSGARVRKLELQLGEGGPTPVALISGVRTDDDVMRGEETEIVGLFAGPELDRFTDGCELILPGTHSKHVRVHRGEMLGFRTFMTGEIFAVLREHSILRHSTRAQPPTVPGGQDREAFVEGARRGAGDHLLAALFGVRTRQLLDGGQPEPNTWYLSGLLIGAELGSLRDGDDPVILCGSGRFRGLYRVALEKVELPREYLVAEPNLVENAVVRGHARLLQTAFS